MDLQVWNENGQYTDQIFNKFTGLKIWFWNNRAYM